MFLQREGKFGTVTVSDGLISRSLKINSEVQGEAYHHPSLHDVMPWIEGSERAPGPVSKSTYQLGWLLAGVVNPQLTGLMIGLGSGAGASSLLYNFPGADLTIIEIDPVIIECALEGFPILQEFINQGRLEIRCMDANDLDSTDKYDVGFIDAYTGTQCLETSFLPCVSKVCKDLYLNYIGTPGDDALDELDNYVGIKSIYGATSVPVRQHIDSIIANWICTTDQPSTDSLAEFVPYAKAPEVGSVLQMRKLYRRMLNNRIR